MSAIVGVLRPAAFVLAAMLACSIGAMPNARAQGTAQAEETAGSSDASAARHAAIEPSDTVAPAASATPSTAESGTPPTTSGPPPQSDFKEEPAVEDEPAVAAPATPQPPSDPLGAAVFARLNDTKPLLARLPAKQREAMQAFYALGDYKPVWIADHAFTPAAKSAIERLRAASEDGLDPNAYPVPSLSAKGQPDDEKETAEADLKLSAAFLLYARDARGGRLNLASISKLVTPTLTLPTADTLLAELVGAGDRAGAKLQSYNPQNAGYLALKERLAALRGPTVPAATTSSTLRLPVGPVLKVGMTDPRVPQLRAFFALPERAEGTLDDGPGEPDAYDKGVSDAVAGFQRSHGLPANGNLTRSTIVALATGSTSESRRGGTPDEAELLVNMERWRWLPGELGADYVLVNVPEFRLRVYRGGIMRDETRVIAGKVESPTPLFSGMMEYAVVNPSWFVPPSILKTMLASGRTSGFEVVRRGGQISLRQPPGERNALGFIKFLFPNQHAVYLHDTPNRSLFSASVRALSHGCVRVDDPFRFADAVLPDWTAERLKKLIGKGERTIRLPEKLPVHLAYFTAYVDDAGSYRTLPDIYGYDAKMKALMGLSTAQGAVAKRPVEPKRQIAEIPRAAPAAVPPHRAAERAIAQHRAARRYTGQAAEPVYRQPAPRYRQQVAQPTVYGERGLWTPQLAQPQPRSWW